MLCVLVFLLTHRAAERAEAQAAELLTEILETYLAQPTLELDPDLERILMRSFGVDENEREVFLESLAARAGTAAAPVSQSELDALVARYRTVLRRSPSFRFGVVPTDLGVGSLLTYQFLHAGWLHLLGNMLFLYLAGPHVEDRWGPWVFLGFYLTAGVVAALFWAVRYPDIGVPLVGASGAIAGVMGAFLICFATSRIRFFYWFFIAWGTFEAPAWLMLPLWLVMEVLSGRAMDVVADGGGGVAHWAHVWGFIFGMIVAKGMAVVGLDARLAGRSLAPERGDGTARRAPAGGPPRPESPAAAVGRGTDVGPRPPREPFPTGGGARPTISLRVVDGVPRSLSGSVLTFRTAAGERHLDLGRIEALAVAAVARDGGRPVILIDLLLDHPEGGGGPLRALRLTSSGFDPRAIVGGDDPLRSIAVLVDRLLRASGAAPLPDAAAVRSPGARVYTSIEDYQAEVLGVAG